MNKKLIPISLFLLTMVIMGLALPFPKQAVAQTVSPNRPVVVIESYYLDKDTIRAGDSFTLFITLRNKGQAEASNLILSMINDNFLPQDNGGVVAVGMLDDGSSTTVTAPFLVSNSLAGYPTGTIPAKLTYTGPDGATYSESFAITLELLIYKGPWYTQTPTPTATAAPVVRPQLVVGAYTTDVDPLQPGSIFNLTVSVRNLGNADARSVTMVMGGGPVQDNSSTPVAGGVSGGSSDLTNFAPLGSSNVFYLGDLAAGSLVQTSSKLIVNVSANPGAYTLKLSFVYTDQKGNRLVDDQIITLLVYQIPQVEINFYRDPNPLMAGQMNVLPLQVVNLGRKSAVLGNMTAKAENADLTNNVGLVGPLDPGGSFTLDVNYMPSQSGEQMIHVLINYTDDFNQAREINADVPVTIQEAPPPVEVTPGAGEVPGGIPAVSEETLWDKVLRFLRGLVGLGSGQQQSVPSEVIPNGVEITPGTKDGGVINGGGKMP